MAIGVVKMAGVLKMAIIAKGIMFCVVKMNGNGTTAFVAFRAGVTITYQDHVNPD